MKTLSLLALTLLLITRQGFVDAVLAHQESQTSLGNSNSNLFLLDRRGSRKDSPTNREDSYGYDGRGGGQILDGGKWLGRKIVRTVDVENNELAWGLMLGPTIILLSVSKHESLNKHRFIYD